MINAGMFGFGVPVVIVCGIGFFLVMGLATIAEFCTNGAKAGFFMIGKAITMIGSPIGLFVGGLGLPLHAMLLWTGQPEGSVFWLFSMAAILIASLAAMSYFGPFKGSEVVA